MTDSGDTPIPERPEPRDPSQGQFADGEEHLDEDTCIDIVSGLLVGVPLERAVDHARACPTCEKRLMAAARDFESARSRPVPGVSGSRGHAPSSSETRRFGEWPRRKMLLQAAVPLALAATILVGILRWVPAHNHASGSNPYWIPATTELQRLRSAHPWDADSIFWGGLNAYEAHQVDAARKLLEEAHATGGLEDLRRLYLASALVNAGTGQEALQLLDELHIEELPLPWREDAYWLKYRALTILGRWDPALELLKQMASWPGRVGDLAREADSK